VRNATFFSDGQFPAVKKWFWTKAKWAHNKTLTDGPVFRCPKEIVIHFLLKPFLNNIFYF
jgi:hypothetical protein